MFCAPSRPKREQKPTTKNFLESHSHSPLLTMVTLNPISTTRQSSTCYNPNYGTIMLCTSKRFSSNNQNSLSSTFSTAYNGSQTPFSTTFPLFYNVTATFNTRLFTIPLFACFCYSGVFTRSLNFLLMLITNMEKLFVLLSLSTISASPMTSGIQSLTVNVKCKNKLPSK